MMNLYEEYLAEIKSRKEQGLSAKPIDNGDLAREIISNVKSKNSAHHDQCVNFIIFNMLPGTTKAANEKAEFLKQIIDGIYQIEEISIDKAFELLSHMKGGPSIKVLIDLAMSSEAVNSKKAAEVLKTEDILRSYSNAEFFTKLPEIKDEIEIVTYVAGEGDISTDLLSPGNQAHSRADRELHGKCFISERAQKEIQELKLKHPDRRIMLVAEKGTMGVGSSRMSGINNVALWTGKQSSSYVPFINSAPIVAGTNGVSPIFLTTVGVTGGIGVDLKNWVKKIDQNGQPILNNDDTPILEQRYSVDTGTLLKIDVKKKKLLSASGHEELVDLASSFTSQKMEFMKAGSSYSIVFGKKLQSLACKALGVELKSAYAKAREVSHSNQGMTAVEKIFNANAQGVKGDKFLHAGSDVRVTVNIVGSQDTTGLMTAQELEAMAATVLAPNIDGAYQSGCHTASVWDIKAQENTPKLMKFMHEFGLVTGRDPKEKYHPMTDVIHKVLNDITVDDWAIIIGGDSHTRMSKGVAFGADSGTVALALATGEVTMRR